MIGDQKTSKATYIRPANTTQYAGGDCVCNSASAPALLEFNVGELPQSKGYITNAKIAKSSATIANALFRLYLFNKAITPVNDNAPFPLLFSKAEELIGFIDFEMTTEGAGSDCALDVITNINLRFANDPAEKIIYGVLVAKGAYIPASEEEFLIQLTAERM